MRDSVGGTSEMPLLVNVLPAKNGHKFLFKIGERYYEAVKHREYSKGGGLALRCQQFRTIQPNGETCKHVLKVVNVSQTDRERYPELYWRRESWRVVRKDGLQHRHQCAGYSESAILNKVRREHLDGKLRKIKFQ